MSDVRQLTPAAAPPAASCVVLWRLHTVMSERGIRTATELSRRLEPYAVGLTRKQLTRIVAGLPSKLNVKLLGALMRELDCDAHELLRLEPTGAPPAAGPAGSAKDSARPARGVAPSTPKAPRTKHPAASAVPPSVPRDILGPSLASLAFVRPLGAS
ncbi:hypothetical protein H6P1_00782 (plasmid) [Variovorax sp. PBL-H6]|uniref:helix-turn-helix domain-containing protein n=1 Tax=Variovorax sp. PBL-H6 TaxID=434009 RepID=UPI0013175F7D|nr:hypothetical protein SRS16P1_00152 [Variovorax sp. SRS16]VTU44527.1 hypothetical protein H6P1_00782 [Variovorax sp. PBL-H6]